MRLEILHVPNTQKPQYCLNLFCPNSRFVHCSFMFVFTRAIHAVSRMVYRMELVRSNALIVKVTYTKFHEILSNPWKDICDRLHKKCEVIPVLNFMSRHKYVWRMEMQLLHSRLNSVVSGGRFSASRYGRFNSLWDKKISVALFRERTIPTAPLSLVSTTEELLRRESIDCGLESREYGRRDPSLWPRDTFYQQKSALFGG
jgi:hypothetical protein